MHPANERWRYTVTPSLIGWAHAQNDPWSEYLWEYWLSLINPTVNNLIKLMNINVPKGGILCTDKLNLHNTGALCKLDESTARRHLKSPRSLSGRSLHLTLVTKWSWSWMTYSHSLCSISIVPHFPRYSYFKIWPWKYLVKAPCMLPKVKVTFYLENSRSKSWPKVQTWWSHLRPKFQLICLIFVSWQSYHFGLRYSKFHIWPWKVKVKVMAKITPNGHIWGLAINQYVFFLFRGNQTIFAEI